uniref:flagellar basal body rod C-terminal domain-containing protein n=1 Tax=Cellvibrio fontiphilus TaxID=1815559 RepID=UPI002B4C12C9|nr:hypothetical protein [Cellvibrio fontiphilus]
MDVGSVVNQGLIGMQKSQASMLQSAQQVAQMNTTPRSDTVAQSGQSQDLASAMVNMKVQAQVFDSSAKVVKTADETIGTLLDVRA